MYIFSFNFRNINGWHVLGLICQRVLKFYVVFSTEVTKLWEITTRFFLAYLLSTTSQAFSLYTENVVKKFCMHTALRFENCGEVHYRAHNDECLLCLYIVRAIEMIYIRLSTPSLFLNLCIYILLVCIKKKVFLHGMFIDLVILLMPRVPKKKFAQLCSWDAKTEQTAELVVFTSLTWLFWGLPLS